MTNEEAQKQFLRKRAAENRELETCCDCPGCNKCKGFIRNCKCDIDLTFLPSRKALSNE